MTETPQEAHDRRQRNSECMLMELHWDGLYRFSWEPIAGGCVYLATRADGGEVVTADNTVTAETAEDLREAVRMDFCLRPVSRDPLKDA